jgi:hypothetical protein
MSVSLQPPSPLWWGKKRCVVSRILVYVQDSKIFSRASSRLSVDRREPHSTTFGSFWIAVLARGLTIVKTSLAGMKAFSPLSRKSLVCCRLAV